VVVTCTGRRHTKVAGDWSYAQNKITNLS